MSEELGQIVYKGETYELRDNTALHQETVGSWMPDFANLKALATYEYDISATSYFKICERPNVAAIKDIADEVLAFRITVTGTNIFSVADVLVRAQPTVGQRPLVTANYQTQSTSASTTGIRYLRTVTPKAANTSYKYEIAIGAYNTTKRHIKVEVFKTTSDWTFSSAATVYSYDSTYQTISDMPLYTNIGLIYGYTWYGTASYANYAGYNSVWMGLFNSNQVVLVAGAAIAANQFAFVGEDHKVYPVTNTSQPILTSWPIIFVTSAIASGANCTWSYLRTWGYGTPATSILRDTLAAHDTVYLKCAYTNGKVYSQNRITPTISVGSNSTDTYYKLGVMYDTTALAFNTLGGVYFTVDMDGNMRAINGYLFNAENASVANAVKRQFNLVGANDYPILFDSNPASDITTATTIPSVTPALKYNPSTGNLSSTLFTGSGAGLTDIPLSSIQGADELLPTKLLHVFHDTENDSYSFTDSLTDAEIADILNSAFHGEINLNVELSDVDVVQLLKYYYPFNYVFLSVLMFETNPVAGIDQTAWTNNALQSYFAIAYALTDPPTFQFISISGTNLNTVAQQFTQLLGEKEDLSNKVTSVDSTSTDDQYPSAKAVYDAIPSKADYSNTPFVGTCSTAAATMAKTVTVDSSFQLVDGVRVRVYMNNVNTNINPTLNVNGTGAKAIGVQGSYGDVSNEGLTAWNSGIFTRNGWYEFIYMASYNAGVGRWIIVNNDYAAGRLANRSATRVTTINSVAGTKLDGGVTYTVVANGATGNPFGGSAAVLWLSHDTSAAYTRQIAMSANTPPHMAFRAQDSSGGTTWQPWEYVLTAANQYDSHMATLAYTASAIDFTTGAVTIPIDGTEYKLLQLTVFNNDISKVLGNPSLFLFNASGTTGYKEGTTTYCTTSSTSSNITVTFDSSWGIIGSTSVDITALYRRIS